jgi:hypothetical protein
MWQRYRPHHALQALFPNDKPPSPVDNPLFFYSFSNAAKRLWITTAKTVENPAFFHAAAWGRE